MPDFPRVLVVSSSSFNHVSGTGVLLTNLFEGWPRERLASLHGDTLPTENIVCHEFFNLTKEEAHWAFPFSLLQPERTPEKVAATRDGRLRLESGNSGARRVFKRLLGSELPWSVAISPKLAAWLDRFKPELIYVMPGGFYSHLALQISARWKCRIVSHMMDDWPGVPSSGLFGSFVKRRYVRWLKELFEKSATRLCISDAMAVEYRRRYGGEFPVFQNPVDVARRRPLARHQWKRNKDFHVLYIGSILANAQLQGLEDIARAVDTLSLAGMDISLDIHSAWSDANRGVLGKWRNVHLSPSMGDSDVFPALCAADALVLPVNFDEASLRFIRYSMPAKVPLYLASGTPILVYGPKEAASVAYAIETGWGEVVSERHEETLKNAIVRLSQDERLRERLGQRAQVVAADRHDAGVVRENFQRTLRDVAGV